jgi:hypothetical protein
MSTINSAFQFGAFLSQLSSSTAPHRDHKVYIDVGTFTQMSISTKLMQFCLPQPTTAFARSIHDISISPLISAVGPLSRLLARTLAVLFDTRADLGLISIFETLRALESLAEKVESDWARSALSAAKDENDIGKYILVPFDHDWTFFLAPSTRETTRTIWTVLKTVLFSTIMIADSSLSTTVYLPPRLKSLTPTPISLALMVLYTLSRLSFIISQFGSVTATSQGGFIELKKVFYSALDIVSVNSDASERLVKGLCDGSAFYGLDDVFGFDVCTVQ